MRCCVDIIGSVLALGKTVENNELLLCFFRCILTRMKYVYALWMVAIIQFSCSVHVM